MSQEARSAATPSPAGVIRAYIKAEYPPQPASVAANQAEDALDGLVAMVKLGAHYENALTRIANHDLGVDYADVELRNIARQALKESHG